MEVLIEPSIRVSDAAGIKPIRALQLYHLRGNEVSLGLEKVRVPDAKQTTKNRNVVLDGSLAEMFVHGMSTAEELVEIVKANVQSNAEADSTPDRVPTAYPALKPKHILAVDSKLGDFRLIGGKSNKVLRNFTLVSSLFQEPGLGSIGIGCCLSSGKRLGGNKEQGGLRIRIFESLSHVSSINVGDEVKSHVISSIVLQSFCDHDRATMSNHRLAFRSVIGKSCQSDCLLSFF